MPSPFPGMDPYIERPQRWPDFHDSFIAMMRGALQPLLRPKYAASGQERVYVAEAERLVRPDVAIIPTSRGALAKGAVATVEPDAPYLVAIEIEEIREPFLQIIDVTNDSRVVTAIEVLSPKNKRAGPGRESYLKKRQELWRIGANVIEIDLLRAGRSTVWHGETIAAELEPFHYVVVVSRRTPRRHEVYSTTLRQRLPRIAVPLGANDPDVTLDLQLPFNRCWDEGPYPALLRYDGPPPGKMSKADVKWCLDLLREKRMT